MKQKYIDLYMDWALRSAQLSHARRLKVGAVIVKDDSVISYGYNGMPSGWDNNCEDELLTYDTRDVDESWQLLSDGRYTKLKTKPEVLHAESNAIAKLAKSNESGMGATMFITHAPCLDCAKLIYQSGISSVFYRDTYRSTDGIEFLKKSNIEVINLQRNQNETKL
jgi:dCMP deaminase